MTDPEVTKVIELLETPVVIETAVEDVLAETEKTAALKKKIPDGYTLLPGGVERRIRINKDYITNDSDCPYILMEPRPSRSYEETYYRDIIIDGAVELVAEEHTETMYGCGSSFEAKKRSVNMRTKAPLFVKY